MMVISDGIDRRVPAIAVVMPVYNRASVVRRAIDSVLAQEFTDFELVVVDDGSTDGTPEVVLAVDDPRVRLVPLDSNRGGNAARNHGIRAANAPLIAFLDSDDVYLPQKLGTIVGIFGRRPELDVLLDSFAKLQPAWRGHRLVERRNSILETNQEFAAALFARRLWKATPAITIKREAAFRAGLFDETMKRRQDFEFLARAAKVARCASIDQILWHKIGSRDAISADPDTFVAATIELYRRHPQYLANPDFRPGLARDIARHFLRNLSRLKVASSVRDARRLAVEFGSLQLLGLLLEGGREMFARRR
jgi:glycosyltransferase involved in cell wall biosynthesis